jgi:hypothetical protein
MASLYGETMHVKGPNILHVYMYTCTQHRHLTTECSHNDFTTSGNGCKITVQTLRPCFVHIRTIANLCHHDVSVSSLWVGPTNFSFCTICKRNVNVR